MGDSVFLEIKICNDCPNCQLKFYSEWTYVCTKVSDMGNKLLPKSDKISIPEWCPLRKK